MDKRIHIRDLIHLLGLSVILFVYYLFLREIFLFEIILLLFVWEIIVNLKYPVEHFSKILFGQRPGRSNFYVYHHISAARGDLV